MSNKIGDDFNNIKEFLEKGKFTLDSPNFEEIVMSKITYEKDYKVRVNKLLKWSINCFTGGLSLAILLVLWFLVKNDSTNTSYNIASIISLFSLAVFGVLILDNFLKLIQNYKISN